MALSLIKRLVYGSALSAAQNDSNMTDIEDEVNGQASLIAALAASGITSYFQDATPTGDIPVGAIWSKPSDSKSIWRFNGATWDDITREVQPGDFGTGILPVYLFANVGALPALPDAAYPAGAFATIVATGQMYRSLGTSWTEDTAATTITGTLIAGQIAAGAISSSHVGANLLIANIANIQAGIIKKAHITSLEAEKIEVGNMLAQSLEANASLYDDAYDTRKFAAIAAAIKTGTNDFNSSVAAYPIAAFGFDEHTPLVMYGQGHATTTPTLHVRGTNAYVAFEGRLVGINGPITVYARINGGAPTVLGSWNDQAGNNSRISSKYVVIGGLGKTDYVEFYVAPCDGTGQITDPALITPSHEIIAAGIHTWGGGAAVLDVITPGIAIAATDIVNANINVVGSGSPTTIVSLAIDDANDEIDVTLDQNGQDAVTKLYYEVLRAIPAQTVNVSYELEVQSLNWTT